MLINTYMPQFDVREYHQTRVAADPPAAFAAFRVLDLEKSRIVRLLFAIRTLPSRLMRPGKPRAQKPQPFLDSLLAMGWVILGEAPGEEVVLGTITQPWEATVKFRGLPPAEFLLFAQPGFTKIVWNIAARKSEAGGTTIVSTETRVLATDPESRRRFFRYWFFVKTGVRIIRRAALAQLRRELRRTTKHAGN